MWRTLRQPVDERWLLPLDPPVVAALLARPLDHVGLYLILLLQFPLVVPVVLVLRLTGAVPLEPREEAFVFGVVMVGNCYLWAVAGRAVGRFVGDLRAARLSDDPDA